MKRIFSIAMTIVMLMCVCGTVSVNVFADDSKLAAYVTDRFSYNSTDKTPIKITSYNELEALNLDDYSQQTKQLPFEKISRVFL